LKPNGALRSPHEFHFRWAFSPSFARGNASLSANTIETRQGHLKDSKVDLTKKQFSLTTTKAQNEVDLVAHWLHFPVQGTAGSAAVGATAIWAFWALIKQDWAGVVLVYQVFKVTSGDPEDAAQQRALRRESLVLRLLSWLPDCFVNVVGMTTSRYRCRPTKKKTLFEASCRTWTG